MTSDREKRIAIIIDSLNLGGAEKSAAILSRLLAEKGYDVYIFIDNHTGGTAYPYKGKIVWISNIITGNPKRDYYYRAYYLKKIKKELNIDVSISFMEDYNFINMMSGIGEKKIISVRTFLSSNKKDYPEADKLFCKEIPKWYNKADKVITMTEAQAQDLVQNYGVKRKKVEIIPNIIDKKSEEQGGLTIKLMRNAIVTIGRLVDDKAHWHAVRAMTEVVKKVPDAHLYILGSGDNYESLVKLSKVLEIDRYIHFEGFTSNVSGYLRQAKILVHTSKVEGFVNALLDGFSEGTAVVCSDVRSSPRELLAPGTEFTGNLDKAEYAEYGILVPKPDEQKENFDTFLTNSENILAEVIIDLLTNKECLEHYRKKALERAKDFSKERIISKWIECIER